MAHSEDRETFEEPRSLRLHRARPILPKESFASPSRDLFTSPADWHEERQRVRASTTFLMASGIAIGRRVNRST